jgi:hypothetical protein
MTAKMKPGEEEIDERISFEKKAWKNAWSPTGEDTRPSIAVSFDDLWDELTGEGKPSTERDSDQST